jgi:hypothetical protein
LLFHFTSIAQLARSINIVPVSADDDTTALGFPSKNFLHSESPLFTYLIPDAFIAPPHLAASRNTDLNPAFCLRLAKQISIAGFGGSIIGGVAIVDRSTYDIAFSLSSQQKYEELSQLLINNRFVTTLDGLNRVGSTKLLNYLWRQAEKVPEPSYSTFVWSDSYHSITLYEKTRSTYAFLPTFLLFYDYAQLIQGRGIDYDFLMGIAKVGAMRNLNSQVVQPYDVYNLIDTKIRKPMILFRRELFKDADPAKEDFFLNDFVLDLSKAKHILSSEKWKTLVAASLEVENDRNIGDDVQKLEASKAVSASEHRVIAASPEFTFELIRTMCINNLSYFVKSKNEIVTVEAPKYAQVLKLCSSPLAVQNKVVDEIFFNVENEIPIDFKKILADALKSVVGKPVSSGVSSFIYRT